MLPCLRAGGGVGYELRLESYYYAVWGKLTYTIALASMRVLRSGMGALLCRRCYVRVAPSHSVSVSRTGAPAANVASWLTFLLAMAFCCCAYHFLNYEGAVTYAPPSGPCHV